MAATVDQPPVARSVADRIAGARLELIPTFGAAGLIRHLPPGSAVSITASTSRGLQATLDLAARLAEFGHVAVPHLAARMVEGAGHAARLTAWASDHGITRVFVIGGDARHQRGPYADALTLAQALLDSGRLTAVGFAGYPDGHPSIPVGALDDALAAKQSLLEQAGVEGWVSTQMCFDPPTITDWLARQRRAGLRLPVHLGVAGVVDTTKLLATGLRIGIGASLRYLRTNQSVMRRLAVTGRHDPGPLLHTLSDAYDRLGISALHVFTFNQVTATLAWQRRAKHGRPR